MPEICQEIAANLYEGNDQLVAALVQQALEQGLGPAKVLAAGLIAGMDRVGRDFKAGELYVPEVLVAARAMHAGMAVLRPHLTAGSVPSQGRVALGTVKGDLHDIGKNLVRMMLEGAGFEVVDLGTDVSPEAFVAAVREHQPQLLGLSALLTTTMLHMQTTMEALRAAGLRDRVKVLIGGAPVTAAYAEKIGADAYAPDAATAVEMARALVRGAAAAGLSG
jgi:5-methyltetrahydrofolate--homocysteine methyltransferase